MKNREILFRGLKADGSNEWVYGSLLQSEIAVNGYCECAIVGRFAHAYDLGKTEVIPETVGQFCGLTDKNGTRIFEGDKMGNEHNVVEWGYDGWCINGDRPLYLFHKSQEVIGNIHQK